MLRRLRYDLYARILRFPLPHFRKVSQGELIPMITSEVESLGGFIGDAFTPPSSRGRIPRRWCPRPDLPGRHPAGHPHLPVPAEPDHGVRRDRAVPGAILFHPE